MTDRRLTVEMLQRHHACQGKIDIFAREWPDGVVPTVCAVQRAMALGLDVEWATEHCFSAPARDTYEQAWVPARDTFEQACAVAWDTYEQACAVARAAYEQACAVAWVEAWNRTASEVGEKKMEAEDGVSTT